MSQLHPNRWMSVATFNKYLKIKGQVPAIELFKFCYSLCSFHEAKKGMT